LVSHRKGPLMLDYQVKFFFNFISFIARLLFIESIVHLL